jgi:hypothetical protein
MEQHRECKPGRFVKIGGKTLKLPGMAEIKAHWPLNQITVQAVLRFDSGTPF